MPQKPNKTVLFLAPLLVCFLYISANATTAIMLSDGELAVSSRLIVTGEVRSVTSAWDDTQTLAWTYVEVVCDRILKGELENKTIVLKQLGGSFADSGMYVFGQPKFVQGQRVLLYLNTGADGSLHVAHNFMGQFKIEKDPTTGVLLVKRSLQESEVELFALRQDEAITERATLKNHLQNLRQSLREQPEQVAHFEAIHKLTTLVPVPYEFERVRKQSGAISPQFEFSAGGVRWLEADSGQPINFFINNARSPVSTGGSTEVTQGMTAWSSQSGAKIRLQIAGQTGNCGIQADGANVISFGDCLNQLDPPFGCSGTLALTSFRYFVDNIVVGGRTFNRLVEADIVFNDGMECFLSNTTNLAEVACHELGHAIGLGHSTDSTAIMRAVAHGRRGAVLGSDDIAGVLAIYPAASGGGSGGGGGGSASDNALFITQSVPSVMTAGQSYAVSVTMRNTGSGSWNGVYKLGSENPTGNTIWGLNSVSLPIGVASGAEVTFSFTVNAPATAGVYNFQWRMLKEGVGGFGAVTTNVAVNVAAGSGADGEQVKITSTSFADGIVGRAYKQALSASGGRAPYFWQITSGSLPPGLTFSSSGAIEGTPTKAGSYSFALQVYDVTSNPNNTDSKRLTINITDANGGGGGEAPSNLPVITRVKVKGEKKLFVIGQNFTSQSFIILNDVFLQPLTFEVDAGTATLFYKGRLNLRSEGTNTVKVLNGSTSSVTFIF